MKHIRFGLVTVALGVLAVCLPARANADTFTLNCLLSSSSVGFNGTCQGISPSQATITYSNTTGIGEVDLTGAANGAKVFELLLNLNPGTTYSSNLFTFTGAAADGIDCGQKQTTTCVANSQKADGDSAGLFDLTLNFLSNSTEPYFFTLKYNGAALPSLNFSTADGLLAAAHIGGFAQECSEWLGDSPTASGSSGNTGLCGGTGSGNGLSVPEPASMLLFGLGTIGVGARMRRRFSL